VANGTICCLFADLSLEIAAEIFDISSSHGAGGPHAGHPPHSEIRWR
jgi:hypothetical protein